MKQLLIEVWSGLQQTIANEAIDVPGPASWVKRPRCEHLLQLLNMISLINSLLTL